MRQEVERVLAARLWGLVVTIVLGWFLVGIARDWRRDYWLMKDARQGVAVVTNVLWTGHDAVAYEYTVGQVKYSAQSGRNYRIPQYSRVLAGEKSIVYYSASHPWLSSLREPETPGGGVPVVLLALCIEFLFLAVLTIINPKSGWAFTFDGRTKLPPRLP